MITVAKRQTAPTRQVSTSGESPTGVPLWAASALAFAIAFTIFYPTLEFSFLDWDDPQNFIQNTSYRGLGSEQLKWMFTEFHMGHYQPLTWLTFGLDYVRSGMDPRGYHLTNTVLHGLNALLFVLLCVRLLAIPGVPAHSRRWQYCAAALVAALFFACHPLRAESVAWITERRDVLSGTFVLLTTLAYLRMNRNDQQHRLRWLSLTLVLFLLGVLSKAIVVMLPLVLCVLDWYPLRRLAGNRGLLSRQALGVWLEKIPFFALSAIFGMIATFAQARPDALVKLQIHDLASRIVQALYGLGFYFTKTIAPLNLSPIYELHPPLNVWESRYLLSVTFVGVAACVLIILRRRLQALCATALCYVAFLAPVLGLVQAGPQIVADRYSYLSCMSWAVLVGAASLGILQDRRLSNMVKMGIGCVAVVLISALAVMTFRQCQVWQNTTTLWTCMIQRSPNSSIANNGYGYILLQQGHVQDATVHLVRAIQINPASEKAHHNLWKALEKQGRTDELVIAYEYATSVLPHGPQAHYNLGNVYLEQRQFKRAIECYERALARRPDHTLAHINLSSALRMSGDKNQAETHVRRAIDLNPESSHAHYMLAKILRDKGQITEAVKELRGLLRRDPDYKAAHSLLEQLQALQTPDS
uniref:Tetratricopeptide repeat domain-containing protein n=1 Tax=uncultured marine thaumarchaeote AD1000_01_F04 TaxID=1455879 RepID=A0A075FG17_9ARCH|nr:tetratricopeptide repeat domain-containing protein [uncultured marine thaumarchaeote AD1000_01_F04]